MRLFHINPSDGETAIIQKLEGLRAVPARRPEQAASGRATFLDQASGYRTQYTHPTAVKVQQAKTLKITFSTLKNARMFLSMVLVALILFAGAGVALAASQSSLPGQVLYPLKIWSEDLRQNLNYYSPASWQLTLQFTDQRIQEIEAITRMGGLPPESLLQRMENQTDQAVAAALRLNQEQAGKAMLIVQTRMQNQHRRIEQLIQESTGTPPVEEALRRLREMIQSRLRKIELHMQNPELFDVPSPANSNENPPSLLITNPAGINPAGTPEPTGFPAITVLPAGGTASPATAMPGANQPTSPAYATAGSPPNPSGSPSAGENQPPTAPENPGNQPDDPKGPGQGGKGGK